MTDFSRLGAFEMAALIRERKIRSEDLVQFHIDEIRKWNSYLNALVEDRFSDALKEARECDQKIQAGEKDLPPLFGVPFTMKEMISVKGMRHTLGSIHRREDIASRDATVVHRLKLAGAILLGTSNVPELGFWFECSNPIYGRTNNPFDLARTAGGSTGGEGALIGAGCSPFGVGSDIGGSIRMPAAFCGVFGHKPSSKWIPITGHFPVYSHNGSEWKGDQYPLTVLGPMTRKAADLAPLMKILMGPDQIDPETRSDAKLKPLISDWQGIQVWTLPQPKIWGAGRTDAEISQTVRNAVRYFEELGANVKDLRSNVFEKAVQMWFAALSRARKRSFTEVLARGEELSYTHELFKILSLRPEYTLPSLAASFLEVMSRKNEHRLTEKQKSALNELDQLKTQLKELLGENSILIMPVHPRVAPRHGSPLLRPFDFSLTAALNCLEFPATSIPMGLDEGLPLAVQVVAGPDQDHLCLSAAVALESAFGGFSKANFPS